MDVDVIVMSADFQIWTDSTLLHVRDSGVLNDMTNDIATLL